MNGADLPELWRNLDRYSVEDAVRLWAFALASVLLDQPMKVSERKDYRREYAAAEQELRENVTLQTEDHMVDVQKSTGPHAGNFVSGGWDSLRSRSRTYTVKEKRTREFFRGPDLAAYAKQRGRPGLFGFEEDSETPADTMRADTREGYQYLIGLLAHALAEKGGAKYKTAKGPNQSTVSDLLRETAKALGASTTGLSDTRLSEKLSQALQEVENRRKSGA